MTARLVPELVVSDIDRSRSFYVDVLGFSILYERPEDRFIYLDRDGAEIMIEQPVGRSFVTGDLVPPYGRGMNLQIEVSDVVALYAATQAAGATIVLPLEDAWYRHDTTLLGNCQFVVADADGYLLRLFEPLDDRSIESHDRQEPRC